MHERATFAFEYIHAFPMSVLQVLLWTFCLVSSGLAGAHPGPTNSYLATEQVRVNTFKYHGRPFGGL